MDKLSSILVYASTFISAAFFMWLSERKVRARKIFVFLALVIPSLCAAFRESGIDFKTYKGIYTHIQSGGKGYTEWGWNLLNKICPTYEFLLFVTAFIFLLVSYLAITKFIDKNKDLAWFIILIVPFTGFFNGMRQMIAAGFVFLAIAYLLQKDYFKCILLVLLGGAFHKTAYFAIILLWVYLWFVKRKKKFSFIVIFISVAALYLAPLAVMITGELGIFKKYVVNEIPNVSWGFLLYLLPPLFFYVYKRSRFKEQTFYSCLALYLLSIPFQVLGFRITYADRFMWFTQIFLAVLVPMIVAEYQKVKPKTLVKPAYYAWFVFYHVVISILMNGNGVYPYRML